MTIPEYIQSPADQLVGQAVVTLYFSDQRPLEGPAAVIDWRLDGLITKMLLQGSIRGRAGEHVLIQGNHKILADWALFIGGGKWKGLGAETHQTLIHHMLRVLQKAGFDDVSLAFLHHQSLSLKTLHQQIEQSLAKMGKDFQSCRYSYCTEISI